MPVPRACGGTEQLSEALMDVLHAQRGRFSGNTAFSNRCIVCPKSRHSLRDSNCSSMNTSMGLGQNRHSSNRAQDSGIAHTGEDCKASQDVFGLPMGWCDVLEFIDWLLCVMHK